jgi:hypothetical protein
MFEASQVEIYTKSGGFYDYQNMIRNIHFLQARVQVIRSNKKWENGTLFTSDTLSSKSSEWPA